MSAPPNNVRVIDTIQGVRFVLPSHILLRIGGIVPLLFGLAFAGFAVFWILGAAGLLSGAPSGQNQNQPTSLFNILFPLFGVPFVIAGLIPVFIGLTLIFGRPEFEIRADRFRSGIRLGPLRRSKWRSTDDIERFEINRFGSSNTSSSSSMHVLRVHVGEDKPLNVTGAREAAWLHQLAGAIASRIDRGALAGEPPEIITRDRDPDLEPDDVQPDIIPRDVEDPGPPPEDSKLWAEHTTTGLTIFIPPRGFGGKPVPALLSFALFWLVITNVVAVGFLFGFTNSPASILAMLFVTLFLAAFEAIGIAVLLHAASLARRRAIIDVTDDARTLLITRSGLRKSSQHEIPAADITAIQIQNSGTSINDQPLRQVTIKTDGDGDEIQLLTGAPEPNLRWLASKLRHALAPPSN